MITATLLVSVNLWVPIIGILTTVASLLITARTVSVSERPAVPSATVFGNADPSTGVSTPPMHHEPEAREEQS